MKLEINLDELDVNGDYGTTVAAIIKDEIVVVVRTEIRKQLKAMQAQVQKDIDKALSDTLRSLKSEHIKNIANDLLKEVK